MAYTLDVTLALGAANTGLTLEMQLKDTGGSNVGSAVTSGFVEFGATGNYLFHYTGWPDGHRGAAVFQVSPGGAIKTAVAINPEEAENTNVKSSTLATATALATVQSDTDDIQTRLPAALVSGRIDASVGAMAANTLTAAAIATDAITAAKIAADAIGASELAADAVTEIQSGLATAAALATVQADTDDIQARLPAALVSGRIDASVGAYQSGQTPLQPTVAGRTLDVATTGEAGLDFDNIKDAAGAHTLTNITVPTVTTAVNLTTDNDKTGYSLANASIVAATFAAGAIDASAIATDAIGSDELAASAVTEIQTAVAAGSITSVTNPVTVGTNNDKTGYSLSPAGVQSIWDALTSALTTAGSIGKRLADNIDAAISSRSSHTAADVWTSGTRTLTSFGTLVSDTAAAVWAAGTRTLTGFGTLAADVWASPTRTLTSFGTLVADTAAAVWAYGVRTLTMSAAEVVAMVEGTTLTITRGDTISIPLTGLGNITARTKLYLTVKDSLLDADADAILQIEESGGLLWLNGATTTTTNASLTVTDATAGDLTIALKPAASSVLPAPQNFRYDVQMVAGTVVTTLTTGVFTVNPDVTRATS